VVFIWLLSTAGIPTMLSAQSSQNALQKEALRELAVPTSKSGEQVLESPTQGANPEPQHSSKPHAPNIMSVQEGDMLQGTTEKLPPGDPRFGDPISDPKGYEERKLAYHRAQPGYDDDGEGRTWWTYDSEIPPPPSAHAFDETGRPVADMQPGILYGNWRLQSFEAVGAINEQDRKELLAYITEHISIGAELQLEGGRTGYQIPSIGLVADWWTNEDLSVFYLRPECGTCEGFQTPVSMDIEQFRNQGQLTLLLRPHQREGGAEQAIRLTFINEF